MTPLTRLQAFPALLALFGLLLAGGQAAAQNDPAPVVSFETHWSANAVHPGGNIQLAVVLKIREPYHVNSDKPADSNLFATRLEALEIPPGLTLSTPVYPAPHSIRFDDGTGPRDIPVFSGESAIRVPVRAAGSLPPGPLKLRFKLHYQACDDRQCLLPKRETFEVTLPVIAAGEPVQTNSSPWFQEASPQKETLVFNVFDWEFTIDPTQLQLLWAAALFGGLLLNFTPCVLPVIPIKIMGLAASAGHRSKCLMLGVSLSLGVIAFWTGIGSAIALSVHSAGSSDSGGFTSTNQLFQYPLFTVGVGVVIAAMALGMCGLFAVRLPQWVYRINPRQDTLAGSFGFGIMTAVLSTPCTAPFMGAAAAWAVGQHPGITLSTFAAIGIGMALPYLVLSAFPKLVDRMPRTGPMSELIKQVMGLFMLAAAAYFVGTGLSGLLADPPDPPGTGYWWAVGILIVAAGLWLGWRTWKLARHPAVRVAIPILGLLIASSGVLLAVNLTESSPIRWIYYTPERYEAARAEGKVVVLEFTAAWCLNCHALEQSVLSHSSVVEALNAPGVAAIKIDLTGNNEAGNQKLAEVGRRTIPLLIVYDRTGREVFRSDAYTRAQVIEALQEAGAGVSSPAPAQAGNDPAA